MSYRMGACWIRTPEWVVYSLELLPGMVYIRASWIICNVVSGKVFRVGCVAGMQKVVDLFCPEPRTQEQLPINSFAAHQMLTISRMRGN
jgi:hypothetical protein